MRSANQLVVEGTPPWRKKRDMGMLRITIAETLPNRGGRLKAARSAVDFRTEVHLDETETARRERRCVVDSQP